MGGQQFSSPQRLFYPNNPGQGNDDDDLDMDNHVVRDGNGPGNDDNIRNTDRNCQTLSGWKVTFELSRVFQHGLLSADQSGKKMCVKKVGGKYVTFSPNFIDFSLATS